MAFLRETSPVTNEPEIRLRFFGGEKEVEHIREELHEELDKLEKEKPEFYSSHIFGNHGKPNEQYEGEEAYFGEKGWKIFAEFLMKTSEVAVRFLRDEPLGRSEKPWATYVERFTHCFLNQLDVPPYIKLRAIGPEVFSGMLNWLDIFVQATRLPM